MAEAKVSVRSDLLKIAEDLKAIANAAQETGDGLSQATKKVAGNVNDQVAIVSGGMNKIRNFGKDLARQLGKDFKGLFSVNAVASGLKLNEQFSGSIKQAVELNDTIRNLAPIFGMTEDRAERFKRTLVKGLSEIGVGSEAAANALQGLAETNVRGDKNLAAYATTASELAGISKQKGSEGAISKGLANVVVAQGGNANDVNAMNKVAADVIRIRNATGKTATEALKTLEDLFSNANSDLKKKLAGGGGVSLTMASLIGGQGSTDFLKRYLGMNNVQRAGSEAQGLGKLIGKDGQLNVNAFQSTITEAKRRGSGNAEMGLTTMGMSDEEAKGFLRLADALKENGSAIENARRATVNINDEYRKTMGLGDSFRANINRVKGQITGFMEKIGAPDLINKATDALGKTSQSAMGSAAVVGGGALLSAVLLGRGMKGIGGALGLGGLVGGELKSAAIEQATGEKVQKVEVINWPGGGVAGVGGLLPSAGEAVAGGGVLATAGTAALAAGAGLAAGKAAEFIGTGGLEDAIKSMLDYFKDKEPAQDPSKIPVPAMAPQVRVSVDMKSKELKAHARASRGASQ